jgi:uncharacterized protein YkwD
MLAGLVLASFTMVPTRRAPAIVTLTVEIEGDPPAERVAPMSRGMVLYLRGTDELGVTLSPLEEIPGEIPDPIDGSPVEAVAETLLEPAPEATPEPEATREPEPTPAPAPDPTPEPTPEPTPAPVAPAVAWVTNRTTLWAEGHMLELMNATRARAGLVPLAVDIAVADTARAHSAAEAQVRYVYHDGPDGTSASRNVPACGTGWYGENTGKIWNENVDALHIEFMAEPWAPINHRTNIMDPAFRRVGVGAVIGRDAMYMTMVFCR